MHTTPLSLLQRLHHADQHEAWQRFVELYSPLIVAWARHMRLQDADVADLTQDVLCVLARKLPTFQYQQDGSFRGWLRTITVNKYRERLRKSQLPMDGSVDPLSTAVQVSEEDTFWDREYREHVAAKALELIKVQFQPTTWQAFWNLVVHERSSEEVARELGLSVGAVYAAKSRVLRRLREELAGLLE